jgi:hypothetical protein
MKQFFRNTTIMMLASVVFLVGSGVNYIHYCCHECSMKGISEIAKELSKANQPFTENHLGEVGDCCAAKQSTSKSMSCEHMSHAGQKGCCKITRLQLDLNDQIAKISVNADFTWHVDLPNNQLLSAIVERPVVLTGYVYSPPLYSSRHLLSLKSVLLI